MTLLNGLFLTSLGLIAGLVYIILDGLRRAEEEANRLLAEIALEDRDQSRSTLNRTIARSMFSGRIERQQQAGATFNERSATIHGALDSQGFFSINYQWDSSAQNTSCPVQSASDPVADPATLAQAARCA